MCYLFISFIKHNTTFSVHKSQPVFRTLFEVGLGAVSIKHVVKGAVEKIVKYSLVIFLNYSRKYEQKFLI